MVFNEKYLPRADVVFSVMFLNKELCEKTLEIITGEKIELVSINAESKNDLKEAALNSIYFDIRTKTVDDRIITLDLQRKYSKERIRNRTVYYACREVATQEVEKGKYEELQNVIVSFILTEAGSKSVKDNSEIVLVDKKTNEVYTELLKIYEVGIQQITDKNSLEMQIMKAFFEVTSEEEYKRFRNLYKEIEYGNMLIKGYESAIKEPSLLDILVKEDKFMIRLTEEERLEERQEGRKEGRQEGRKEGRKEGEEKKALEIAKTMLQRGIPLDFVTECTKLKKEVVEGLQKEVEQKSKKMKL